MKSSLKFSVVAAATLMAVVPNLAFSAVSDTYDIKWDSVNNKPIYDKTINGTKTENLDITARFDDKYLVKQTDNIVNIDLGVDNEFKWSIYGGFGKNNGDANYNKVFLKSGNLGSSSNRNDLYGGYSYQGSVAYNELEMSSGSARYVYGGQGYTEAKNNNLKLTAGSVDRAYGGYARQGKATNNSVTISGGEVKNSVYGGYTEALREVTKNHVSISGGTIGGPIYGGLSDAKDGYNANKVNENTVDITNGSINGDVYGGRSNDEGQVDKNPITISGGTIKGNVYGGYSKYGEAINNPIPISGGTIKGDVYGGYSEKSNTTNNTITYIGGAIEGTIYGGYSDNKQKEVIRDNVLNIGTDSKKVKDLSAKNIQNFKIINFYLPSDISNGETVLNLTDTGKTDLENTEIYAYLSDATNLTASSVVNLIKTAGSITQSKNFGKDQTEVNIANLMSVKAFTNFSSDRKRLFLQFKDTSVTPTWVPVDQTYNIIATNKYTRLMQEEGNPSNQETQEFAISGYFDKEELTEQSNNTVNINLGSNSFDYGIFGGGDYNTDTTVSGNTVTLNSGIVKRINGGISGTGEVSDNKVIIKSGSVGDVYGGATSSGTVSGNSVAISSGIINYDVYGGITDSGTASGNSVTITGGTINCNVHGGQSNSGTVSSNSVTISGGTIDRDVLGGFSIKNTATDNTVNFTGGTIKGTIYGGRSDDASKDMLTGNTLNIGTSDKPVIGLSAENIYNFETINFYLPSDIGKNSNVLELSNTGETDLSNTTFNAYLKDATGFGTDGTGVINLINTQGTLKVADRYHYDSEGVKQTNVNVAGLLDISAYIKLLSDQTLGLYLEKDTPTFAYKDKIFTIVAPDKYTRLLSDDTPKEFELTSDFIGVATETDGTTPSYSENTVNVNLADSDVFGDIYGGYSETSGDASKNEVNLNSGDSVGEIFGGYSADDKNAIENKVILDGVKNVYGITGGFADLGEAKLNEVYVYGGSVDSDIHGGLSNNSNVIENYVYIYDGEFNSGVYGGMTLAGSANKNEVVVNGGTISGDIYAGYGDDKANENKILIAGGTIMGDVVAGFGGNEANDNKVFFKGGEVKGTINGGWVWKGDAMPKNNALYIGEAENPVKGLIAGNIGGFDSIHFYLPSDINDGETALSLEDSDEIGTDLENVKVYAYLSDATNLNKDSVVHLIENQTSVITGFEEANGDATAVNIADLLDVKGKIVLSEDERKIDLTFEGSGDTTGGGSTGGSTGGGSTGGGSTGGGSTGGGSTGGGSTGGGSTGGGSGSGGSDTGGSDTGGSDTGGSDTGGSDTGGSTGGNNNNITADENAKSLLETNLAMVGVVNEGANLFIANLDKINPGEAEVFAFANGADKRLKTGSHVDIKGFNVNVGVASDDALSSGDITTGLFVEYGKGSYESKLDNGTKGEGDTEFIGGGAFARYSANNGFYGEISGRVGKAKVDYEKSLYDAFDISSTYYGAHLGFGKIFNLTNSNDLDIYARGIWSKTAGNDLVLSGVNTHFDSVTSLRTQIGFKDNIKLSDTSKLYAGLAYQYEFDGEAKGTLSLPTFGSADIASPKLKGSTGIGKIGYVYENSSIKFEAGAKGYVGKEKGYSGNLGVTIKF